MKDEAADNSLENIKGTVVENEDQLVLTYKFKKKLKKRSTGSLQQSQMNE